MRFCIVTGAWLKVEAEVHVRTLLGLHKVRKGRALFSPAGGQRETCRALLCDAGQ
jgi:hypothetical protein